MYGHCFKTNEYRSRFLMRLPIYCYKIVTKSNLVGWTPMDSHGLKKYMAKAIRFYVYMPECVKR